MTAEKLFTPNPPKLEMVKVPPMNSSGLSFFSWALETNSLVSELIWLSDLMSADLIIGVMSPSPMSTAKLRLESRLPDVHIVEESDFAINKVGVAIRDFFGCFCDGLHNEIVDGQLDSRFGLQVFFHLE